MTQQRDLVVTLAAKYRLKEYSSSDPAIRATKPTISEILIGY